MSIDSASDLYVVHSHCMRNAKNLSSWVSKNLTGEKCGGGGGGAMKNADCFYLPPLMLASPPPAPLEADVFIPLHPVPPEFLRSLIPAPPPAPPCFREPRIEPQHFLSFRPLTPPLPQPPMSVKHKKTRQDQSITEHPSLTHWKLSLSIYRGRTT